MTIEESKMMWKLEVENNKPLYSSFSKEMKRLYNKVDELINEGVITYEDFTNDVIDSITTTIVDNGKNNAEPSRADQVNAMCDMLFKKYEEYKKVEHTGGDREVLMESGYIQRKMVLNVEGMLLKALWY